MSEKKDSVYQLDRRYIKFRKKYRKGAAYVPQLYYKAAAFVASSTASRQAQIAYGADEKKCFISYLTVDIQKYLQKKTEYGGRELLYVGSLIQRKGLDLLFPALAQTREDICLTIVGEGQEKEALMEQAKKLGITSRIRFLGYVEGEPLRELYHNADVFILPTREDCFGLVILEAMCASLPVISSKYADGAFDLVQEGENGCIIDPEDTAAFAAKIDQIFADERWDRKAMSSRTHFLSRKWQRDVLMHCIM